jgi:cytidylate kinase
MNKIIAVDGPTASGKGTLAERLAKHFSLPYLNTGGLYRTIALYLVKNNLSNSIEESKVINVLNKVNFDNLNSPELYYEEIGAIASKISPIIEVRKFLLDYQKNFAYQDNGAVLDGRDIGTVICPDAKYKFYITATAEERANRRFKEMILKGKDVKYEDIYSKIVERDRNDISRANSPLKKAVDAVEVDTTNMTRDEVFNYVKSLIDIV